MQRTITKRVIGFILIFTMILSLVPTISLPVIAENEGFINPVNGVVGADFTGITMPEAKTEYNGFMADPKKDTIPSNAIHIKTEAQLRAISYAEGYYVLDNDIYLTAEWVPIYDFTGTFDGQGHSINNLYVLESSNRRNAGLFSSIDKNIIIKNIAVNIGTQGVTAFSSTLLSASSVGGLIGYFESLSNATIIIDNCYVTGSIIAKHSYYDNYAGGLIGSAISGRDMNTTTTTITIRNSYTISDVTAGTSAGGLLGYNSDDKYETTTQTSITIDNSYSISNVTATNGVAGGLIGYTSSNYNATKIISIKNCYSNGNILSSYFTGGLIGSFVSNSYDTLTINISIENSYAVGDISTIGSFSETYAGGIVGAINSRYNRPITTVMEIKNSYVACNVTALSYAGGFVGSYSIFGTDIVIIENSHMIGGISSYYTRICWFY